MYIKLNLFLYIRLKQKTFSKELAVKISGFLVIIGVDLEFGLNTKKDSVNMLI